MTWHFPATAHAAAFPNKTAIRVDDLSLTWQELLDASAQARDRWRFAFGALHRVALVANRNLSFFIDFLGLIRAGFEVVLLDPDSTDAELAHAQRRTGAQALLYPEASLQTISASATNQDGDARTNRQAPAFEGGGDAAWAPDRILFTIMTSGTTGDPRPIDVTCTQVIFSTLGSAARLGSLPQDCWHAPLPLHHVGGIMVFLRALILGFEAEYTSTFDASISAARLESGDVALASFVPVMLSRILTHAPALSPPPALRAILLGGAATPDALLEKAHALSLPIARSWGMSETTSQIATAAPGAYDDALAPLPFAQISSHDGLLQVDGPQAQGGALKTSDRGEVHQGRVIVHGRADDLFISGGENIDPLEIERILLQHPDIQEALVFGRPSEAWGRAVAACIVAHAPLTLTELRAWCSGKLAPYKMPKHLFLVKDLPRNALGKTSRKRAEDMTMSGELSSDSTPIDSSLGAKS